MISLCRAMAEMLSLTSHMLRANLIRTLSARQAHTGALCISPFLARACLKAANNAVVESPLGNMKKMS